MAQIWNILLISMKNKSTKTIFRNLCNSLDLQMYRTSRHVILLISQYFNGCRQFGVSTSHFTIEIFHSYFVFVHFNFICIHWYLWKINATRGCVIFINNKSCVFKLCLLFHVGAKLIIFLVKSRPFASV